MDLALTTNLPSPIPVWEKVEYLPKGNTDTANFQWVPGKRILWEKDQVSLEKGPTIDMEAQKAPYRSVDPTLKLPARIGYYLRNALMTYFEVAGELKPQKPLVDLYA
jgi:hypothetical protein